MIIHKSSLCGGEISNYGITLFFQENVIQQIVQRSPHEGGRTRQSYYRNF
jgi:hypothetical protein